MNISFNQLEKNHEQSQIDQTGYANHVSPGGKTNKPAAGSDVFAWDHSSDGIGINAYRENGVSGKNMLDEAASFDSKNSKNYMVVMSNTLSDEDYKKLQEEGGNPGSYEAGEMVTLMDQIKITLAKAGVDVTGFTDDLNTAAIAEAGLGEGYAKAIADALTKKNLPPTEDNVRTIAAQLVNANEIKELTDGAKKYLIENELPPTVDNLYKASYAGGKQVSAAEGYYQADSHGYMAKKGTSDDLLSMDGQIKDIIKKAGMEPDEKTMGQAKWLLEKGLLLTEKTLHALSELDRLKLPMDEKSVALAAADAISIGLSAADGNMVFGNGSRTADTGYMGKAIELEEKTNKISDEAIHAVIREGKSINLYNLIRAEKQKEQAVSDSFMSEDKENTESRQFSEAKKQLVEVQLKMSAQANLKLMKLGISIDLEPLHQLADMLEKEESLYHATELGRTLDRASEIRSAPAETLGISVREAWMANRVFTLEHVYDTGKALSLEYAKAGQSYEALMTAPRADLGDSIKKAFRNLDELLSENGMDVTDENRRAARILGYNQMELTSENMQAVKEADAVLKKVLNNMTPEKTLRMLREGVNPLSVNLDELADYFENMQDESDGLEKFSKYLYRLEKNNEISEEEKEAYIGVYRLLRQIEKGDDAAIGTVVSNERELNLENLLSAVRTRKKGYVDAKIDDAFGLLKEIRQNGMSISDQIMTYYRNRAGNLTDEMADQGYEQSEDMKEFYESETVFARNAGTVSEDVFTSLLEDGIGASANRIKAEQLLSSPDSFVRDLQKLSGKKERENDFLQDMKKLSDAFEDGEEAVRESYMEFARKASEAFEGAGINAENHIDVRSYALDMRQVSLWTEHAKQENYYVPMQLADEMTMVHVKIVNGTKKGTVTVDLKNGAGNLSAVTASFRIKDKRAEGIFAVSDESDIETYKKIAEKCSELILEKNGKETDITCVHSQTMKAVFPAAGEKTASTKELYQIARAFMQCIEQEVTKYES